MEAIKSLCKKSIWFSNGILTEFGETNKVISKYINDNNSIEIRKSKCGSENAKTFSSSINLISIRLINIEKREIEILDGDSILGIEVTYNTINIYNQIAPSVNVYNNHGEILFSSINRNFKKDSHSSNGNHRYTLWIPENTFSSGHFKVGVIISSISHKNNERLIQTKKHLGFDVIDNSLNEIFGDGIEKEESCLRPQFEWAYEKI